MTEKLMGKNHLADTEHFKNEFSFFFYKEFIDSCAYLTEAERAEILKKLGKTLKPVYSLINGWNKESS